MFSDTNYIELLGLCETSNDDAEPLLVEKLRVGEGIAAVAFDSDNGEELWNELAAIGVKATKPNVGERTFGNGAQTKTVRFEILRLPREATPGLRTFICRHLDPSIVYQPSYQDHGNTARAITEVTLVVDSPSAIGPAYEALLGRPKASEGCLSFATGNCLLHFATATWIEQNLWPCYAAATGPGSFMTVSVRDLRRAEQLAVDEGFAVKAMNGKRLLENTDRTCGVGLIYEDAKD